MALLREETQCQHRSLEQTLPWQEICSDSRCYVDFLARFYGFYLAWEPLAKAQLRRDAREFMEPRRKTPLLAKDLRWFGWRERDFAAVAVMAPERLCIQGEAAALGSCYVLEGSTLGGQILSRELERRLGLRDGEGYSYFRSYGAGIRDAWNRFGDFLCEKVASEQEVSAAVAGAKQTFGALEEWLTGR